MREAFDTYHVIESLVKSGFKDGVDTVNQQPSKTEINYYDMSDTKKK